MQKKKKNFQSWKKKRKRVEEELNKWKSNFHKILNYVCIEHVKRKAFKASDCFFFFPWQASKS